MEKIIAAIPDAMITGGCCAVAIGAGLWSVPAGFVVGGILSIGFGVLAARARQDKSGAETSVVE